MALTNLTYGAQTSPTVQKFLSGSGTYVTPAGVLFIIVKLVGAGGGGGGGSASGTSGGNTTFGTSLLTANGGTFGVGANAVNTPGAGGSATVNSPAIPIVSLTGGSGTGGASGSTNQGANGGCGGNSPLGGGGGGGYGQGGNGTAASTNSGAGGGGGGSNNISTTNNSAGGGAGGYIEAIITSPSGSYAYSVGTAGSGGASGGQTGSGGNGGSGYIEVTEYYSNITQGVPVNTFIAPTYQIFTSGSGTYNLPTSPRQPLYLKIKMCGGGGGSQRGGRSFVGRRSWWGNHIAQRTEC